MKRIKILIVLLALCTHYSEAQDYTAVCFTLDSPINPTQNITYTARDEITMLDGFVCSSTNANTVFGLNDTLYAPTETITYVNPDTIENRTIDQTNDFGSLPGSFNVSSSGAGNYSVPIYTPRGSKGTTPSLSVIYNSSMQNGLLGASWTLSGTSTIHRMGKNYFEDSEVEGIKLDTTDILGIDGNRMIRNSGYYIQDSMTFVTKFESYRTIKAYSSTGNSPEYFLVTDNRGYTYEYGNTLDSKVQLGSKDTILAWKLNKVTDPQGNYAIYEYDNALSGQAYLYRITYSGNINADLEPYNEILISYQIRSDDKVKYLLDQQTEDKYLVEKIEVKSFDNLLREYQFNYSSIKNRTFLSEIILENAEGEQYNSTIIGWNDFADTIMTDESSTFYLSENTQFGDFNSDGYSDYVAVEASEPGYLPEFTTYLYLNDGSGGFSDHDDSLFIELEEYVDHFTGDFNGDGKSDVVVVSVDQCSWEWNLDTKTSDYYRFRFLSGPDLELLNMDSTSAISGGPKSWPVPFEYDKDSCSRFFVSDFNGDGLSDFAVAYGSGFILYGNSTELSFSKSSKDFPVGADENFLSDFTGDRKPDYATFQNDSLIVYELISGSWSQSNIQVVDVGSTDNLRIADFNGDGITDIYYANSGNEWYIKYGTGSGYSSDVYIHDPDYSETILGYFDMVYDFNGDGLDDIISFINDTLDYPYLEGWAIFFRESIGDGSFVTTDVSEVNVDFSFENTQISDVSGDGMPDILTLNENMYFMYNPDDEHLFVDYIENGIGTKTTINYSTLTKMEDNSTYSQVGNFTFPQQSFIGPLTVVESYQTSSSLHNDVTISEKEYRYTDAVVHKQGLGFLGFKNVEIKRDSVHTSKSYNSFSAPDYYASVDTIKNYYNGETNPIKATYFEKNYYADYCNGDSVYIIYNDRTTANDLLSGFTTITDPTIDSLGNLTSTKTTADDGSYQRTIFSNYLKNGSQFPQQIEKTSKHNDDSDSITSITKIVYDTVALQVDSLTNNYGKSNQTSINFISYDDFGNPTSIRTKPIGLSSQTITSNFDHTGRFLYTKTNPLGELSYQYDTINGRLTSEKDIYENEVGYQYNNWGALVKTISPFGLSRTVTIDWADISSSTDTLFYILTSDTLGTYSKQYKDYKGRSFYAINEGFEGNVYSSQMEYNSLNQLSRSSNLYANISDKLWNSFSYQSSDGRIETESYIGGGSVSYSYDEDELTKTINGTKEYTYDFDALGNITSVTDPVGNDLYYKYNSTGSFQSIRFGGNDTISSAYNDAGIDTISRDPSHGTIQKRVNALGQPIWIKDGKGNEFDFTYDNLYRLTEKKNSNNSSEYYTITYVSSGNGLGQVASNSYTDGNLTTTLSYSYDSYGGVRTESKEIGNKTYSIAYKYDSFGRLDSITDSNGKQFDYRYDAKGYNNKIYYEEDLIWELDNLDLTERTENLGSNISVSHNFNSFGQLDSISAGDLFSMEYSFSSSTGNLNWRKQRIFNLSSSCIDTLREDFSYDTLDRLTQIVGPNDDTLFMSFDTNIKERTLSKTDAGEEYKYTDSNDFLLTSIDSASNELTSRPNMSVSYTSFNKVDTITEGDYLINFDYGPNAERVKMEVTYDDTLRYTRYYFGSYELTEYPNDDDEEKTWFSSGSGIFGFNRVIDVEDQNFYIIKDHLGSVMTVANEDGDPVEFFSYDAWGRRRNDSTWVYDTTLIAEYTTRGFTGHEHIDETCLINMNGRVYDPLVGLFLSPDPVLQEPMNPLNYNRYSYVLNNPLKYTDPSGYNIEYEPPPDDPDFSDGDGGNTNWGLFAFSNEAREYSQNLDKQNPIFEEWEYNEHTGEWRNKRTGETIDASDYELEELLSYIGGDFEYYDFAKFFGELSSEIDGSDFNLSVEFGYGKFWVLGNSAFTGQTSSFGAVNSSNYRSYGEVTALAFSTGGAWETIVGTVGAVVGDLYYSKTYGTWMGKNFKLYKHSWGGNGITGGKNKFAKKASNAIKWAGRALGSWNAFSIYNQYTDGEISLGWMIAEQGVNGISMFGGLYGAAAGIGWEVGRTITNTNAYQKAKYNYWYNHWERKIGPPSKENEVYWNYFFNNY